jgi:phosphoribosylcarboxyaminoimidazole (NCAIR) mutase
MKGQYEQQCNAAALEILGVPVLKSLKIKHLDKIKSWTRNPQDIPVVYPDITEKIIDMVIRENIISENRLAGSPETEIHSVKALKAKSLERILKQSAD